MVVYLSNKKETVVVHCYRVDLSVDRTHIMCHCYPPEDFLEFDLDDYTLTSIEDC